MCTDVPIHHTHIRRYRPHIVRSLWPSKTISHKSLTDFNLILLVSRNKRKIWWPNGTHLKTVKQSNVMLKIENLIEHVLDDCTQNVCNYIETQRQRQRQGQRQRGRDGTEKLSRDWKWFLIRNHTILCSILMLFHNWTRWFQCMCLAYVHVCACACACVCLYDHEQLQLIWETGNFISLFTSTTRIVYVRVCECFRRCVGGRSLRTIFVRRSQMDVVCYYCYCCCCLFFCGLCVYLIILKRFAANG